MFIMWDWVVTGNSQELSYNEKVQLSNFIAIVQCKHTNIDI